MSTKIQIYYNPACRKCREALALLDSKGVTPEIIEYIDTPPTAKELKSILAKLGMKAEELIRTKEQKYIDNYKGKILSEDEWIKVLVQNPELIQRPIIIKGDKAIIGRSEDSVCEII